MTESVASPKWGIEKTRRQKCHPKEPCGDIRALDVTVSRQKSKVQPCEDGGGSFTLCRPRLCADLLEGGPQEECYVLPAVPFMCKSSLRPEPVLENKTWILY